MRKLSRKPVTPSKIVKREQLQGSTYSKAVNHKQTQAPDNDLLPTPTSILQKRTSTQATGFMAAPSSCPAAKQFVLGTGCSSKRSRILLNQFENSESE